MTTYYQKLLEPVSNALYTQNPALFLGNYTKFGELKNEELGYIPMRDPWNAPAIHSSTIKQYTNSIITLDEPGWADGSFLPEPTLYPLRTMTWSATLTWKQMKSLEDDPTGMVAQGIRDMLVSQQANFASEMDELMLGYLSQAGNRDYMRDWKGALGLVATGSSSASNPADSSAAAGTCTDLQAVNLSGASQTVDALNNSFGVTKRLFMQMYDSASKRAMYEANNTYDVWGHPAAFDMLEWAHEANAAGEVDYSQNTLAKLRSICNVVPTFAIDAAYDGVSGTIAQFAITMNTKKNFFWLPVTPYIVEPWKEYPPQTGQDNPIWRIRGYQRFGVLARPYWVTSYYYKAVAHMQCTPYE